MNENQMEFAANKNESEGSYCSEEYDKNPSEPGKRPESMMVKFRTNEHENLLNKKYRLAGSGNSEIWESEDK
jgi:hypothetical protein